MPPMYVNIGAYVDEGTMIDSHALVGSCAQVGKRVHVNAEGDLPAEAVADLFPAYDDDGGLLLILTPE